MRLKTNLVLGAVFLALLAFVYFHEIRGGEKRKEEAERAKELLAFDEAEVQKLVIDRGDTVVALERGDAGWALTGPVEDEADQAAVDRYLRNVKETERERVVRDSAAVAGNPGLTSEYGLDDPRLRVALRTGEGWLDTLVFGSDTPTETYTYVQERGANPEILLVRAWRFDNLNKGAFDLRDRRVLPFTKDQVVEVRLSRQDTQIVLAKDGGHWRLRQPVQGAADDDAVDGLLNRLQSAQAESFVAERTGAGDLARFGMDSATVDLTLLVGQDRAEKRLRVGRQTETPDQFYAQDLSAPQVFAVDSSLVGQLRKSVAALRDRTPVTVETQDVKRLEMERQGVLLAAEKDTSGTWRIVQPEAREARSWKLDQTLTDLTRLEAQEYVLGPAPSGRYGLDPPRLLIRLSGEAGPLATVRLGTDTQGQAYLKVGEDPQIYRVDQGSLEDLDVGLEELAQPVPAAPSAQTDTASAASP
ncbi:MAG: DUF4340 domain-containing protein [Candidatus Latescibacterota bacterium]